MPPGTYDLSVEAQGFRKQSQSNIVLNVNQRLAANFSMVVGGGPVQTVNVSEAAPLLATQDATTGQIIDRKYINDLPLLGRSVTNLAFLAPGVTEVDSACPAGNTAAGNSGGNCTSNNFVSNGSRNATADFLTDGVSTTDYEQNTGVLMPLYTPSVEAVQEFVVQQASFSAEYGFSGDTVVNLVTRSGTNKFHGTAFEYLRNSALDANSFFNKQASLPLPSLKKHDFGGAIGGPIQRDRTFFFFDYDAVRQKSLGQFAAGVPSALERTGDFGELCGYAGGTFDGSGQCSTAAGQLWDPYSGTFDPNAGGAVRSVSTSI